MEDANPAFGNVLGTSLARAFALEGDRASLYGSGSANQPRGLKNTSGVSITPFVGANGGVVNATNGNFGAFIQTVGRLKAKNYAPTGILFSPRTETGFASLTDTSDQPLSMPDYLKNIPQYVTGQIPDDLTVGTSADTSDFFVGDWSNLLIGMRTDFRIMPLNEQYLVSNGQVGFVGWMRMDVQLARTDSFEILSAIRA
jgi:HK97 family phage major capsid protein